MEFERVLITGGTSGIGLALVNLFSDLSVEVHAVSRNLPNSAFAPNIFFHTCDLSSKSKAKQFLDDFTVTQGVPDVIINNAGSGSFYQWCNFPLCEIEKQMNLLFSVPVMIIRHFAPLMRSKNTGIVVNITSLAVLYPLPFMPMYNAGKSALSAFTQSMILEYQQCPRFIDLRMGDVSTNFNRSQAKQPKSGWTNRMNRAWRQIDKQLIESPAPEQVSKQIVEIIKKRRSGCFYIGSLFQSKIAPFINSFIPFKFKIKLLQLRYNL